MRVDLPDTMPAEDGIVFNSDRWEMMARFSYTGKSGINFRFDYVFTHRVTGLRAAVLKLSGNGQSRHNQISALSLISGSENDNVKLFIATKRLKGAEKIVVKSLNLNYIKKVGTFDHAQNITWIGESKSPCGGKKRDKTAVVRDIINLLEDHECKITELVYKCNLNYARATELIDELMVKKMIVADIHDGRKVFRVTREGTEFVRKLSSLQL